MGRLAECHPDRKHRAFGLCSPCYHASWRDSNKHRIRGYRAWEKWGHLHPDEYTQVRKQSYLKRYGLTLQDYDYLYEIQQGNCAICSNELPKGRYYEGLVDHDHKTGKYVACYVTGAMP